MGQGYRHVCLEERIEIEKGLERHESLRSIARRLGRDVSTISREVRRNAWRASNTSAAYRPVKLFWCRRGWLATMEYRAGRAHDKAVKRSRNSHASRVFACDRMVEFVTDRLRAGWTPAMIAGRVNAGHPGCPPGRVCHETIYQWIYSPSQKHRGLSQYLVRGHTRRRRRRGRRVRAAGVPFRVSIHSRPVEVGARTEFGHWEGDTILGAKSVGDGIHTEVERVSRMVMARKITRVRSEDTIAAQEAMFAALPAHAARSVTMDNGSENCLHHRLDQFAMPVYFTDPYCSWQKGTVEHFNGRIRRYLPKGTDFTTITTDDLNDIITTLNNQPLKCLGWETPAEVFHRLCSNPDVTVALQN